MKRLILWMALFSLFLQAGAQNCRATFVSVIKDYTATFTSQATGYQGQVDYYWNFGDGKYSALPNPMHAYTQSGKYVVALYVTDGVCRSLYVDSVNISVSSPGCKAGFGYEISGDTVQFYNLSTGDDTTISWIWDFGDGSFSSSQDPLHIYGKGGLKNVILKMSGQLCNDSASEQIYIHPRKSCLARFSYQISNDTVVFQELGQNSHVIRYWNFGDNGTSTARNPMHIYSRNGNYAVCLQLDDTVTGYKDSWCDTIQITAIPCAKAYFTETTAGNKVSFYNMSGPDITHQLWLFGDGNYSTQLAPEHVYQSPGDYTVKLFVTDSVYLCSDSFVKVVHIMKFEETYTISGRVLFAGQTADRARVLLIRSDSIGKPALSIDTILITAVDNGRYTFKNVRKGYYTLKAIPTRLSSGNSFYMPGYITGEYLWADVTPIYINFDFNEADIDLSPMKSLAGTALVSGEIRQGTDSAWSKPGGAVYKRPVSVFDQNGLPSGTAISDTAGKFSIRLPGEGIYTLYVDIPGKRCSPYRFEITSMQLHLSDVLMIESPGSTFPMVNNTGFNPLKTSREWVYPNPFSDRFIFEGNNREPIYINDLQGKTIYEFRTNGEPMEIDGSSWPAGLFILKQGDKVVRLVKVQ